jgi:hypothetical protein
VRIIGLEPTRLAAPDPKSGMSTNFTISAKFVSANIVIYFKFQNSKLKFQKNNYFIKIRNLEFQYLEFQFVHLALSIKIQ